jgi:hypothetical protein
LRSRLDDVHQTFGFDIACDPALRRSVGMLLAFDVPERRAVGAATT